MRYFTPFYETDEWVELLGEEGFLGLSQENKQRFMDCSVEDNHRRQYYAALGLAGYEGPAWEELTDEQRQNIREENDRYTKDINDLGRSLGRGFI